ncbi:MAG: hypothetical protein APF80_16630 [Alphaproteobacteria bacterium BRH_c36]|nr:MAG: hypothetical protein APF80_16630 [Alphaproteobacteria bacterium BRH_c36]
MHVLVSALGTIRAPILVALLAAAIVAIPGQSHEIFRAVRESTNDTLLIEVVCWAVGTVVLVVALVGCSVLLIEAAPEPRRATFVRFPRAVMALALVLPLVPLIAMAFANIDSTLIEGKELQFGIPIEKVVTPAGIAVAVLFWAILVVSDGLRERIFTCLRAVFRPLGKRRDYREKPPVAAAKCRIPRCRSDRPIRFGDDQGPQ